VSRWTAAVKILMSWSLAVSWVSPVMTLQRHMMTTSKPNVSFCHRLGVVSQRVSNVPPDSV